MISLDLAWGIYFGISIMAIIVLLCQIIKEKLDNNEIYKKDK